jgi:hypothetical protein
LLVDHHELLRLDRRDPEGDDILAGGGLRQGAKPWFAERLSVVASELFEWSAFDHGAPAVASCSPPQLWTQR